MKIKSLEIINVLHLFHSIEQEQRTAGVEQFVRQMDVVDRVMAEQLGGSVSRNSLKVIVHRRFNRALSEGLIEQVKVNHFRLTDKGKMRRLSGGSFLYTNYRNSFGEDPLKGVQYSFHYDHEQYQGDPDINDRMRDLISEVLDKVTNLNNNKKLGFKLSLEFEGEE